MKVIVERFVVGILIFSAIVMLCFKACQYRIPVSEERFVEFMWDNDYYVVTNVIRTDGEDYISGDNDGLIVDVTAYIDTLNIKIDYYEYDSGDKAIKAYTKNCEEAYEKYFVSKINYELMALTNKSDFIKTTEGENYNRFIVRSPDKNVRTIVSRIQNTLIVVKDTPDTSFTKVMDSLGNIGY